jgi:hypothetical protein
LQDHTGTYLRNTGLSWRVSSPWGRTSSWMGSRWADLTLVVVKYADANFDKWKYKEKLNEIVKGKFDIKVP